MGIVKRYLSGTIMVVTAVVLAVPPGAAALDSAVTVTQAGVNSDLAGGRQIVRSSSGRLYFFNGDAGHTGITDGWVEAQTAGDGASWSQAASSGQWFTGSGIGVAIDGHDIVHLVTFDWNQHPYYQKFNTLDSVKKDHSWEGYELLNTQNSARGSGACAISVDASGVPHVLYTVMELYKGKTYQTLTYAVRRAAGWSVVALWPKEKKISFTGRFDLAVGPDNLPYVLMGTQLLKGSATSPTVFESKELGTALSSFVIHKNGDVRTAVTVNGMYAHYLHDALQPWGSGWTLLDSKSPESSAGVLVLAHDVPYTVRRLSDGIWLQKNFAPPLLAVAQPSGDSWQSFTTRWSFHNHTLPGNIDLGMQAWNAQSGNLISYGRYKSPVVADFSATPFRGLAPLSVTFQDNSVPPEGGSITSREWDFGNSGAVDATIMKPLYLFDTAGKYTVRLKVTDSLGGSDTKIKSDYIEVLADSDGDGIPDAQDNCPFDYNPLQIDLNGNGVGDVCEPPLNRLQRANYLTRMRAMTSADKNIKDITGIMTDGLLDQGVSVSLTNSSAVSIQINKEARNIRQLILRYHVAGITGSTLAGRLYIMPYNKDLVTTPDSGLVGGVNGWNEVDVTALMHRMDGFGVVKFRIAGLAENCTISEILLMEKVDAKEIAATPDPVDFGSVMISATAARDVTVRNNGSEPLKVIRFHPPSSPFSVVSDGCTGKTVQPNESCVVSVLFAPGRDGEFHDLLIIDSDDAELSCKKVAMKGLASLTLTGVVTDAANGLPLNNVKIEVTGSGVTITTTTNIKGEYAIPGVLPGSFTARLSLMNYVTQTISGTITQSRANTLDAQLAVNYASLGGIVTDRTTGAPLAGATVTVTVNGFTSIDPADRVYTCNGLPLTVEGYVAVAENDGNKMSCKSVSENNTMLFKVRNPLGVADPFTVSWNGIGTLWNGDTEYLAQSFRPTVSGTLGKVSFYLPANISSNVQGYLHVLLKSKLGGDRGTHLALSESVEVNPLSVRGPGWVDFTFPSPVAVTAGAEYFLEINGTFFEWFLDGGYLYSFTWSSTDASTGGSGYKREGGLWSRTEKPLAFRAAIDGHTEMETAPSSNSNSMYGGNDAEMAAQLYNPSTKGWEGYLTVNTSFDDSDGYGNNYDRKKFNGDDLAAEVTIDGGLDRYYDPDGWITVKVWSYSTWSDNLVTDQFKLTFMRSFATVTDANGAYSFPSLLYGSYTVHSETTGYVGESAAGNLIQGDHLLVNLQLNPHPPLLVTITSPANGTLFVTSRVITVTGTVNHQAIIMVNGVPASVNGTAYSVSLSLNEGVNTITATATDQLGQSSVTSIMVTFNELLPVTVLNGTITDAVTGFPVTAVAVTITDSHGAARTLLTDNAGRFSFTEMVSGSFSGTMTKVGYISGTFSGTISSNQTLTLNSTLSPIVPTIGTITVTDITATSAVIRWSSDQAAETLVEYGETIAYGSSITEAALTTSHVITLSGLTPSAAYHFRISSTNSYGNVAISGDTTFTTTTPIFTVKNLGDSGDIAIMAVTGNYDGKNADGTINVLPRQEIAKEYFKTHGEKDFLVLVSSFDYLLPEPGAKGFYLGVRNDVQGIGQTLFDNSALFGGAGRVQGTIDLGNVTALAAASSGPLLDETVTVLNHELMHRYGAYVRFKNQDGTLNTALLGKDGSHWSYLLDTQGSFMYGNGWRDDKNGAFTSTAKMSLFSPLDLYLMGMIPKGQVPPMLLIESAAVDKTQLPQLGATVSGSAKTVTIDEIIAAEGARIPNAASSQKRFSVGFVLLTRPGDNSGDLPAAIELLRSAWAGRLAGMTNGAAGITDVAAELKLFSVSPSDGSSVTGPDVTVSGAVIDSTGAETGVVVNGIPATVSGSHFVAYHVPLQEGGNSITIVATDVNGLVATVTRNVNAIPGEYLRIASSIDSGVAPLNVVFQLNGSFIITMPAVTISGPVQTTLSAGASPTEFTSKLTVEGTYTIVASAVAPDGKTYSDTVTVVVSSRQLLNNLLKAKWEGMKAALATGNVSEAVVNFSELSKAKYQQQFTALSTVLPQIASEMGQIAMVKSDGRLTEYDLRISENGNVYSFLLLFIKDRNGLWRIRNF